VANPAVAWQALWQCDKLAVACRPFGSVIKPAATWQISLYPGRLHRTRFFPGGF